MKATRLSRRTSASHTALYPSALVPTRSHQHDSIWRLAVSKRLIAALLFAVLAIAPAAFAQSVTGQISGTVTDASGAVVAGAAVKLTHDLSQQARQFTTDSNGSFMFVGIVPGAYTLGVTQSRDSGPTNRRASRSPPRRDVDLHEIKLQVGDVTTSIAVEANTVHVATDSSDRSVAIGLRQIEDTPTRGRNPLGLIMTLPGVQTLASNDFRGWSGGGIPAINGGQTGQVILNLDGAASQDSGNLNPGYIAPSVDAIGEVQAAGLELHCRVRRTHRRPVDLHHQERAAPQFHGSGVLLLAP